MFGLRIVVSAAAIGACGGPTTTLYPAGRHEDDGHGELAAASAKLLIGGEPEPEQQTSRTRRNRDTDVDDVSDVLGSLPRDDEPPADPSAEGHYDAVAGLTGVLEGTVRWSGPRPTAQTTPCGAVDSAAIHPDRGLGGVVVYIERPARGRPIGLTGEEHSPLAIGGNAMVRDCEIVPRVQIIDEAPANLNIHAATRALEIAVTSESTDRKVAVERAGQALVRLAAGVTRLAAPDNSLTPAWVHVIETPYYAISDDRGRFRIEQLPPGLHDVVIWHPPVVPGKPPLVVHRRVVVSRVGVSRVDVSLAK